MLMAFNFLFFKLFHPHTLNCLMLVTGPLSRLMSASRSFSSYKRLCLNECSEQLCQCSSYIASPLTAFCYSHKFTIVVCLYLCYRTLNVGEIKYFFLFFGQNTGLVKRNISFRHIFSPESNPKVDCHFMGDLYSKDQALYLPVS